MLMVRTCVCCIAWVGARLNVDIGTVPAAVHTFGLCEGTLGTHHHQVADGQLSVVITALARTDGAVSCIT